MSAEKIVVQCCARPGGVIKVCDRHCDHIYEGGFWETCGGAVEITRECFSDPEMLDQWYSDKDESEAES